jgi:DNA-binding NarL/FixJ family response regulator
MAEKIKLLLADDHQVVRAGLSMIFAAQPDITVVGEAKDGAEAIYKALELKPDVVLMDVFMPRINGIEAMTAIREQAPEVKVIILTISAEEEDLLRALRSGAQGYLLKNSSAAELIEAVKKCAEGETVLTPSLAGKLVKELQHQTDETPLSAREGEVLQLVSQGLSNTEISGSLFISESTVRTYLRRLFEKLHVRNRVEAATYAHSHLPLRR